MNRLLTGGFFIKKRKLFFDAAGINK